MILLATENQVRASISPRYPDDLYSILGDRFKEMVEYAIDPTGERRFDSPSAQFGFLGSVVLAMRNRKFTAEEIELLILGGAKVAQALDSWHGKTRRTELSRADRAVVLQQRIKDADAFIAERPAVQGSEDARRLIQKILAHIDESRFRANSFDRAVLVYLCELGIKWGTIHPAVSQGDIAIAVGANPVGSTISSVLGRLIRQDKYLAIESPSTAKKSATYTLRLPPHPSAGIDTSDHSRAAMTSLNAHEAWFRVRDRSLEDTASMKGLGRAAPLILLCLARNPVPMTWKQVAAVEGITPKTVRKYLHTFESRGVVFRSADGWTVRADANLKVILDEIATAEGTRGISDRRATALQMKRNDRANVRLADANRQGLVTHIKNCVSRRRGETVAWGTEVRTHALTLIDQCWPPNEEEAFDEIYDSVEPLRVALERLQLAFFQAFSTEYRWKEYVGLVSDLFLSGRSDNDILDALRDESDRRDGKQRTGGSDPASSKVPVVVGGRNGEGASVDADRLPAQWGSQTTVELAVEAVETEVDPNRYSEIASMISSKWKADPEVEALARPMIRSALKRTSWNDLDVVRHIQEVFRAVDDVAVETRRIGDRGRVDAAMDQCETAVIKILWSGELMNDKRAYDCVFNMACDLLENAVSLVA
ncbi:hypothetical protein B2J88_35905 [Rhodococcus sp. SRB_17]|nr:hypothetical protein [Rhodococcus sp. SRB_17]